ncbi:DUF421 domain-containing protein [Halobacterium wangiae]|uniref:DUF421 domain-containing protein n=1 Tax=Halobacterium wangiae TaxID=2902623 RepID=UPI001E29E9C6|nr:YetF domain-containing protein [Halobacterium wangiae]
MSSNFFFGGWQPLVRIVVVGVVMYVALVTLLRISGSRTLSSMNAFDFIITVALGSVFGRALTASRVSLAEALLAFALLVGLQYVVTRMTVRWSFVGRVVTNPPVLLYYRGEFLRDAMRRERVPETELVTAARKNDHSTLAEVEAIVLESSGEFSVVESVDDETAFGEGLDEDLAFDSR